MRDECVTGQRTENLSGGGMGSRSQVLPAHLQVAANGVQVYFEKPKKQYQGLLPHQERSIPVTRQNRAKGAGSLRLGPRPPAMDGEESC